MDHLQKTKEALLSGENNLRLCLNNKAEDLTTLKKLTNNSPTMRKMFPICMIKIISTFLTSAKNRC